MSNLNDFRQVAELPAASKERLVRASKNPLDKCTLVSIFPRDIDETKDTIEPGKFHIDAGSYDKPSILVVGSSSWWNKFDVEKPALEIPNSSIQVSNSIINDYCNGMLECDMDGKMPGLFFVLGEVNVIEVKTKYKKELDRAKIKQENWYKALIRHADSIWARTNNNPLAIWDLMRIAAKDLNENSKVWLQDFKAAALSPCVGCGSLRNPEYPICPSCKMIDNTHPMAKDLKFAV